MFVLRILAAKYFMKRREVRCPWSEIRAGAGIDVLEPSILGPALDHLAYSVAGERRWLAPSSLRPSSPQGLVGSLYGQVYQAHSEPTQESQNGGHIGPGKGGRTFV